MKWTLIKVTARVVVDGETVDVEIDPKDLAIVNEQKNAVTWRPIADVIGEILIEQEEERG